MNEIDKKGYTEKEKGKIKKKTERKDEGKKLNRNDIIKKG